MTLLKYKIIKTPVGHLTIVVRGKNLAAILWDNERQNRVKLGEMVEDHQDPLIFKTEKQLQEYFSRHRTAFDLPLDAIGTQFQQRVWELLNQTPYGTTSTYKDIAVKAGQPKAVRAIGTAIGRNPISIVIPCHRIIASNGSLAGFAGGLNRKKLLLDLESPSFSA